VLARREWQDPAIAEGLMLDVHGRLVCGTMTNVFIVQGTEIVTPALTRCGVAGVIRGALIEAFRAAGLPVTERDLEPRELAAAAEVFLTNALIGVWPVKAIDDLHFTPGPIARRAQAWVATW
jgi:4-amino-4-deoxychorismate lyase